MKYSRVFSYYFFEKDVESFLVRREYEVKTLNKLIAENFGKETLATVKKKLGYVLGFKIAYLEGDKDKILCNLSEAIRTTTDTHRVWSLRDFAFRNCVDSVARRIIRVHLDQLIEGKDE